MDQLLEGVVKASLSPEQLDELRNACRDPVNAQKTLNYTGAFEALLNNNDNVNSLKTLANLLYHHDNARSKYVQTDHFKLTLEELPQLLLAHESEISFVKFRLLFLATIDVTGAKYAASFIPQLLGIESLLEKGGGGGRAEGVIIELLRVLYNITRQECVSSEVVSMTWECLGSTLNPIIIGNTFNLYMNFSIEHLNSIPDNAGTVLLRGLESLLELFDNEEGGGRQDAIDFLPVACLALGRISKVKELVRSYLRRSILPAKFDRNESVDKGVSVKAKLVRLLGHSNDRLSGAVGDMLFILCHQKGYGCAAGFLYRRNLLNKASSEMLKLSSDPPSPIVPKTAVGDSPLPDSSSDEEEISNNNFIGIDPVTARFIQSEPAGFDMTEAEKEAESKRLFELFDQLEGTGMMHIYTNQKDH